jgi:hypothetical protein
MLEITSAMLAACTTKSTGNPARLSSQNDEQCQTREKEQFATIAKRPKHRFGENHSSKRRSATLAGFTRSFMG